MNAPGDAPAGMMDHQRRRRAVLLFIIIILLHRRAALQQQQFLLLYQRLYQANILNFTLVLAAVDAHNQNMQRLQQAQQRLQAARLRLARRHPYRYRRPAQLDEGEDVMALRPREFQQAFRMTKATFIFLVHKLALPEPSITRGVRGGAGGANKLPARLRIAIAIYYWAQGGTYLTTAIKFKVSQSTVQHYVDEVGRAVNDRLKAYLAWPNKHLQREDAGRFEEWCGFPGVVGAIDGCHIILNCPGGEGKANYYNYKGSFSMLLMAVCDFDLRFINVSHGYTGRYNDISAVKHSSLYKHFEVKYTHGIHDNHKMIPGGVILGDAAFPSKPWLMIPYKYMDRLSVTSTEYDQKSVYNFRHSSGRMVIEQAFGLLKGKWGILSNNRYHRRMDEFQNTLNACILLHNFLLTHQSKHYLGTPQQLEMWAEEYRNKEEEMKQRYAGLATDTWVDTTYYTYAERKRKEISDLIYNHPILGNDKRRKKGHVFGPKSMYDVDRLAHMRVAGPFEMEEE